MSPVPTHDENNGKVEYGRLLERMDTTLTNVGDLTERIDRYVEATETRLRNVEAKQAAYDVEIDNMKASVRQWDFGNTVGVIAALIIAWFRGQT